MTRDELMRRARANKKTERYSVASATSSGTVGLSNPVDPQANASICHMAGFYSLPSNGEEAILNGDDNDPIMLGVIGGVTGLAPGIAIIKFGNTQIKVDSTSDEITATNGGGASVVLKANGDVEIDGTNIILNGGTADIARKGDLVEDVGGGVLRITEGNSTVKA